MIEFDAELLVFSFKCNSCMCRQMAGHKHVSNLLRIDFKHKTLVSRVLPVSNQWGSILLLTIVPDLCA